MQRAQVEVLHFDEATGRAPKRDRPLTVDLWYPARAGRRAAPAVYTAAFPSEPPAPPARFSVQGIAVRGAPPAGGGYPLVIVSHGYSGAPAAMTWITENLASKGYVVAAIRHEDPPITDTAAFVGPLLRRPLDIAFVAASLRQSLAAEHLIDPERVALVGYSMGGYGVLTSAGAVLDPDSPAVKSVPGGLMLPYARGGDRQAAVTVPGVRAVVAISPAGGGQWRVWGRDGLAAITAPLLLIQGDHDHTVDYRTGALAVFDEAVAAHRYLLTFLGAGHDIGLIPTPEAMSRRLWDQSWFEDPVWSAARVNAINAHFITAFLDLYVKGDASRAAYLNVRTVQSSQGEWPAAHHDRFDAYSPDRGNITVWKGFQRHFAEGLELRQAEPSAAPR